MNISFLNFPESMEKEFTEKEQNTLSISRINFSKRTIGLQALNNSRECSKGEHVFNLKRGKNEMINLLRSPGIHLREASFVEPRTLTRVKAY